jgi:hypothetical protein
MQFGRLLKVLLFFLFLFSVSVTISVSLCSKPSSRCTTNNLWKLVGQVPSFPPFLYPNHVLPDVLLSMSLFVLVLISSTPLLSSTYLDARISSYLLAFIGVLFSGIQGGIHRLAFRFENWRLISFGFLTFALSMGLWTGTHILLPLSLSPSLPSVLVWLTYVVVPLALNTVHVSSLIPTVLAVLTPLSLSAGVLNTMINTSISTAASKEELGETLGLASSVSCFSRVLGPLLAGGLASLSGGYSNVGICTVLLCGSMFYYSRRPNLVLKLKEIAAISNSRLLLQERVTNDEVAKEKKTT